MLPMPGAPSSSWQLTKARLASKFEGASVRVCIAFWLFGLINNIFYVIILTAALDLVGPSIPKATVLLSCIIPGLATKIVTPYFIHLVPYSLRILIFVGLATCGMLAVALSPNTTDASSITSKISGIVLANISSGAGEVNFLALTHFYGPFSLASWGSGTGAAGLLGAGAYTLATTTLGFSVHATLLSSCVLGFVMLASYFALLPLGPLKNGRRKEAQYQQVAAEEDEEEPDGVVASHSGLLEQPTARSASPAYGQRRNWLSKSLLDLQSKLSRAQSLVVPYMLPLFLVYLAEYTINQGVAPTLLFAIEDSPFRRYREFYPTYGTIYQLGVFISRSSLPFIRIKSLYIPTWLQVLNLGVLTVQALYPFIPTVWFIFGIILWEGLLGGLVYVSTFAAVREDVSEDEREFSLGAVTVSDSAGIFCAGLLGAGMETALCKWQVDHGRDWCRQR
ncbi:Putative batten's disease protein Cln3 [Septoria linicola]|uniref:Protein BTN n=1 Tax=Septoria linicola TaxID=215465 RepID=A0A9Q9AIA2_9PEZI|nr:Putative batten's disease protein Cln3 [Septoria linicola]